MAANLKYEKLNDEVVSLLDKYYLSNFRDRFNNCNNVVLPKKFELYGGIIHEMDIQNDDVWVSSFPRSGTTWTQEMVWCIIHDLDSKKSKEILNKRFPWLEQSAFNKSAAMITVEELPKYILDSVTFALNLPSPRFIKTHLPYKLLPERLQLGNTTAKIIYVSRNSRDTCISQYHFHKTFGTHQKTYEEDFHMYCELFMQGAVPYAPYWDHVLSYWDQRSSPNVLFIMYEDMKKDLKNVILKTAAFLGKQLSEERIVELSNHLSFDSMKNNPLVNWDSLYEEKQHKLVGQDFKFIRNGEVGEWKKVMSPQMIKKFQKWDEEHTRGTDFTISNIGIDNVSVDIANSTVHEHLNAKALGSV